MKGCGVNREDCLGTWGKRIWVLALVTRDYVIFFLKSDIIFYHWNFSTKKLVCILEDKKIGKPDNRKKKKKEKNLTGR